MNLASVKTAATDRSPELFGSTLFFTSTRDGNYDVYTAEAVPERAAISLVVCAAAILNAH